jgi:hypothetical protein
LRNRKAAVASQLDERRAAARFEPTPDDEAQPRELRDVLEQSAAGPSEPQRPAAPPTAESPAEQDTYTERLLAAKKRAQKDRGS